MDRKLIGYLPQVLQEVSDFQEINKANEPEISLAWDTMAHLLADQFLNSATEWGVRSWEQDASIYPKDTDTMEARKARLKAKWGMQPPYTLPWLRSWLADLCGSDGVEAAVRDYTLDLQYPIADPRRMPEPNAIKGAILEILPENIRLTLTAVTEMPGKFCLAPAMGPALSSTALPTVPLPPMKSQVYVSAAAVGEIVIRELPRAEPVFRGSRTVSIAPVFGGSFSITRLPVLLRPARLSAAAVLGGSYSVTSLPNKRTIKM